jgi:hypothetical protein
MAVAVELEAPAWKTLTKKWRGMQVEQNWQHKKPLSKCVIACKKLGLKP